MGPQIGILQAMLCGPHKRDAQTNLDMMTNHEAEVEQQEQMPNQKAEAELLSEK